MHENSEVERLQARREINHYAGNEMLLQAAEIGTAPEAEHVDLREALQRNYADRVRIEIELAETLLGLSRVEIDARFTESGAKSVMHAEQAATDARKGLARLDSEGERAMFEPRIAEIEAAIRDFKKTLPRAAQE